MSRGISKRADPNMHINRVSVCPPGAARIRVGLFIPAAGLAQPACAQLGVKSMFEPIAANLAFFGF